MSKKYIWKNDETDAGRTLCPLRRCRLALLRCGVALHLTASVFPCVAAIETTNEVSAQLAELNIEDLVKVEITSTGKKQTQLDKSPAAVSVITPDDIRRLGFTSIPEALRMVPGLDVARVNANQWAISSRGFNMQYANKLLVLMDGRSVYTPLFGGVYWDVQDMVLEDLDRIEVIRGPGATLWGANAVNGVINIMSKNSRETQGWLISSTGGTEDQPGAAIRYGGEINPELHYRAYVKYFNREGFVDQNGDDAPDDWDSIRGGFRMDWEPSGQDLLTLQGDYYSANVDENVNVPMVTSPYGLSTNVENPNSGGNILGRWTRTFSDESHLSIQAYFDHFQHEGGLTIEKRDTADIQLEHRFALGNRNDIVWGVGYRFTSDEINETSLITWTPSSKDLHLYSAFVQDEIKIVPDRFHFTLGTKVEHNDFTGFEIQPGARLLWTPTSKQSIWASVSRSVSTPSRYYRDSQLNSATFLASPSGPVVQPVLFNDPDASSEKLDAFELGYRIEPTANLSIDIATFYNIYDDIEGLVAGDLQYVPDPAPGHMLLPLYWQNSASGKTYGGEISIQWKPVSRWLLSASYSLLQVDLDGAGSTATSSPEHQASLRSYLTLPCNMELNGAAYFVDQIESASGISTVNIPAYVRLDLGLVWHPTKSLELGIWGQNLLDDQHAEGTAINSNLRTEVPRSVMARVTLRF